MSPDLRVAALRRFALAITVLNVLGHTVLGFEQSWAYPLVALMTAYALETLLECVSAWASGRSLRFSGGPTRVIDFLLSAHITGLACSMLLYANARLLPIAFATAVAIGSKYIFRVAIGKSSSHVFNPSNLGIAITLLLFPWVGIAPPYQFTEGLSGWGDWLLPAAIVCTGTLLNGRYTKRLFLVVSWLVGFAIQAIIRGVMFDHPIAPALAPMTGVAFVLFTFYMVSDPATTPSSTRGQIAFGLSTAMLYGTLVSLHVVFGLFFALALTCVLRGALLQLANLGIVRLPAGS